MASVNNTNTTTNCASCGKEGGNLNTCNKCKLVKYCNAACKKKHRSKHKKACERRVAELHDEGLFREHPPREDCPICFLPLPLDITLSTFKACCGKTICRGCTYTMEEEARGRRKIDLCAFCREPIPSTNKEAIKQLQKLMKTDNANAFYMFGGCYAMGIVGMPQDFAKSNELFLRAGELGCAEGYFNLGASYSNGEGVDMDKKKAKSYYQLAAMGGNLNARQNLGCGELRGGNIARAYKHCILAAKAGYKDSLDSVKVGFMNGIITKDGYEHTLRAYQEGHDEMKSDDRDRAASARLDT